MREAPEQLDLAEDPMGGWWSAADAPPEARVSFTRTDLYEAAVEKVEAYREALMHIGDRTSDGMAMRQARAVLAEYEDGPDE